MDSATKVNWCKEEKYAGTVASKFPDKINSLNEVILKCLTQYENFGHYSIKKDSLLKFRDNYLFIQTGKNCLSVSFNKEQVGEVMGEGSSA